MELYLSGFGMESLVWDFKSALEYFGMISSTGNISSIKSLE